MIRQEVWMDIKWRARQGASIRQMARETGLSRVTIRRILASRAPRRYGPRRSRPGKLAPFVGRLEELWAARPSAPATVLYEAIAREGYPGHYEGVKRWVRQRRRAEAARRRACVRFETAPGLEGQFDWKGPVRGLVASEPEAKVYFFRFLLGWSRARWTLVVRSLALPAVLASLRWAFEQMGGVPRRLVLDNPKTAVLRPKPHLQLHRFFLDFCEHYGCEPDPAWPYHPERKGKMERSYRDLEDAGVLERVYPDFAALQQEITEHDAVRMERVHATTGEAPAVRFQREREELLVLPALPFDPRLPETRRVLSDCTVSFQGSRYSVPHPWVGTRVTVKADPLGSGLEIFAGAQCVARHERVPKGERAVLEEHVAALRRPRFERLRARSRRIRRPRLAPEPRTVVPWPLAEVEQRPIEEYAALTGGTR